MVALALLTLLVGAPAGAETLGDARQLSRLGEPLRLYVPLRSDGSAPVTERCLGVAGPAQSDGLPHILTANVAMDRRTGAAGVTVTTAAPIREPVVRLLVRTHCDGATRLYTLFLEPPGSSRQVRAVAQAGPRMPLVGLAGAPERTVLANPAVTVIPVVPAQRTIGAAGAPAVSPTPTDVKGIRPDVPSSPSMAAAVPAGDAAAIGATPAVVTFVDSAAADPAVLEAENATLRQQIAQLSDELQRLQQPVRPAAAASSPSLHTAANAAASPGWESAWPVGVALGGLAALGVGGFVWRRRHAGEEWALTGPPSHRVASRTSLAEPPVTFKHGSMEHTHAPAAHAGDAPHDAAWAAAPVPTPINTPTPLLLQPSAEDLGRDLERELFIAERAHSALERSHPDVVDALTRCWGTAAARLQLAELLQVGSTTLARMSGEAVAELRLLVRIADDLGHRTLPEPAAQFRPAAPAW